MRWSSTIHLLSLAAEDGVGPVFERYRQELSAQPLPPNLRAEFELSTGRGYVTLGHLEEGSSWLEMAAGTANAHGLHQMAFEAEAELVSVRTARRRSAEAEAFREFTAETNEVAEAMRKMRELVVGGKR